MKNTLKKLKIHGRTVWNEKEQTLFFNWTCSGVTVHFTGTSLKAKFKVLPDRLPPMAGLPESPDYYPWIDVTRDGENLENRMEIRSDGDYELWSGEPGTHVIRLVKLSENERGKLGLQALECDGEILQTVEESMPVIEFVGDSITAAFGNESADNAAEFKCSEENGWMSYGAIAARELGCDWRQICISGISTYCPENPLYPIPGMDEIYHLTDQPYAQRCGVPAQEWPFESHKADIVVINLGSNDANVPRYNTDFGKNQEIDRIFQKKYGEFLASVRKWNGPDTKIICCLGPIDYYFYDGICKAVEAHRKTQSDDKVYVYKFLPVNAATEGMGAVGHPSRKTHERMGRELAFFLRNMMQEQ